MKLDFLESQATTNRSPVWSAYSSPKRKQILYGVIRYAVCCLPYRLSPVQPADVVDIQQIYGAYAHLIILIMKRYSVLYLLQERYHHIGCTTHAQADSVLQKLSTNKRRIPVGIYDAKTELFEWEPTRERDYNQAGIEEQGKRGDQIITIAQALRRRDSGWQKADKFQHPSFFA